MNRALPYLLSAPALLLFAGVVLVPLAMTVVLSFNDWSMTRGIIPQFTLKNWHEVFGDAYFYGIFFRTLRVAVIVTIVTVSLLSRLWRTLELRVDRIELDEAAQRYID